MYSKPYHSKRGIIAVVTTAILCVTVLGATFYFHNLRWNSINEWADKISVADASAKTAVSVKMIEELTPNNENMLSGLISLFGIVLSIWVGLNIYSVLGKDELAHLEECSERLSIEVKKMQDTVQTHRDILKTNYETNFSELLSCIERSLPHYASSRYLMEKFNEFMQIPEDGEINQTLAVLLPEFIRIENFFLAASEAFGSKSIHERKQFSEKGIGICDKILNSKNKLNEMSALDIFICGYAHLRKGDFNFYIGHRQKDGSTNLDVASIELNNAAKMWFGVDILNGQPTENDLKGRGVPALYCLAYLYNIIGESFNVRHQEPIKDLSDKYICIAKKCLQFSACEIIPIIETKESSIAKYFATYYRNYGTILDYTEKQEPKCIEWYRKALKLNFADSLSHINIATWELKKVEGWYSNGKKRDIDAQKNSLDVALQHLELYRKQSPADPVGYEKTCWGYTLLAYVYYMKEGKDTLKGKEHLKSAKIYWELAQKCRGDQLVFNMIPKEKFDEKDEEGNIKDKNGQRLKKVEARLSI